MTPELAVCGAPYHPIRTCPACHRLYMRRKRAQQPTTPRRYGFKGPECLECGGIKSRVAESGYTDEGQRIRKRLCLDCGQACASVEVYIDPSETTFFRLCGERLRRKRTQNYDKRGQGYYRSPGRWVTPDELKVSVRAVRHGKANAA